MAKMGFFVPCNIGPAWLSLTKPDKSELRGVLDLKFEHVLPVHGDEVLGGAKEKFRPIIEKLSS